jgi:hypothetical protein
MARGRFILPPFFFSLPEMKADDAILITRSRKLREMIALGEAA